MMFSSEAFSYLLSHLSGLDLYTSEGTLILFVLLVQISVVNCFKFICSYHTNIMLIAQDLSSWRKEKLIICLSAT